MSAADRDRARQAIDALKINGANREIAEHWLSRWHDGKPPRLGSFNRDAVWQHAPAMMVVEIRKDKSLRCIHGGAFIRLALGFDIKDQDLLALSPIGERDARMAHWWQVVEGAVSVTYREFKSQGGPSGFAQGIGLPFSDQRADGSRYFLMHTNWRPVNTDWLEGTVQVDIQTNAGRHLMPFRDTAQG